MSNHGSKEIQGIETSYLPPILTMEDVARYLRIGRTKAYELAYRPDFPSVRIGKYVRVNREAFLRWCGHPDYQESTN